MSLLKGERNPFLHDPVVQCLFEFLSFKDIKNCRLVCTKWKFVSEPFLRKLGKVVFLGTFRPASFIEYSQSHLPAVPFTSFKFTNFNKLTHPNNNWTVSEIHNFFATFGTNIKIMEFDNITVFKNEAHGRRIDVLKSQMNEFIDLAPNIVDLKIVCTFLTSCVVSLFKLVSVKNIHLEKCTVGLASNNEQRIIPLKLCLQKVKFQLDGVSVNDVSLNDFIDFSNCTEIECHPTSAKVTFDMSRIVSVLKLDLDSCRFLNMATSRGKIDHLVLNNYIYIESTEMQIKKLTVNNSNLLSLLPTTLEELTIADGVVRSSVPIDLPNLKNLKLCSKLCSALEFTRISIFKSCTKLTNVLIGASASCYYSDESCLLNISWILPTLKTIKLTGFKKFTFVFDSTVNVDILELDVRKVSDAQNFVNYVRPKVLVCSEISKVHCDDFIDFVLKNKQIGKIYLGFYNRGNVCSVVNNESELQTSKFSSYVDQEALTYEFETGQGKAITEEQFQNVIKWS